MEDVPGIIPISVGVIRLEHVSDELLLFLGYGRTAGGWSYEF